MKAVYCVQCGDVRGLLPKKRPTVCQCGISCGRWVDPVRGIAIFAETQPDTVRCIGIHNGVLGRAPSYDAWKDANGYLFQVNESMILNFRPGGSSDTSLATLDEVMSA